MARKTFLSRSEIRRIVKRIEESEDMGVPVGTDSKLSALDYEETRPLKDKPELRKQLLEKRAEGRVRQRNDLREVAKILKDSKIAKK